MGTQVIHPIFSHGLQIVHKYKRCLLGLLSILFGKRINSFLYLLNLRLVLNLRQSQCFYLPQKVLHICLLGRYWRRLWDEKSLFEVEYHLAGSAS
jgi:hypothetical protein